MEVLKPILLSLYALSFLATVLQLNGLNFQCPENERQALLDFKRRVTDQSNRLSSWVGNNCCQWKGVACNNITGHVIKLDLRNPFPKSRDRAVNTPDAYAFFGDNQDVWSDPIYERSCLVVHEVNSSLLELKHLNYLDFSWNNFSLMTIPKFFGSFQKLKYLNLSQALFRGDVPPHLGNLSALRALDLSFWGPPGDTPYYNSKDDYPYISVISMHWISTLHSLKHLDLSGLDIGTIYHPILSIPSLLVLRLSNCNLGFVEHTVFLSPTNLTSLLTLDLSFNQFSGSALKGIFYSNLISLLVLDLSSNSFSSLIPIWNMTSLEVLNLSDNLISSDGSFLYDLNKLNNRLSNMKTLDLSKNSYDGEMVGGNFTFLLSEQKLESLCLSSNRFNGSLPSWLHLLKGLRKLDLSSNSFEGPVPASFGQLSSLKELSLDSNHLNGSIPASLGNLSALEVLNLESNQLSGLIPMSIWRLSSLTTLKLGDNQLRGKIPLLIEELTNLTNLDVSLNQLSGQIPISITKLSNLVTLALSENQLTGEIPTSVGNLSNLTKLDLSSNKFSGIVPQTLGQLSNLTLLDLSNNSLNGIVSEVHFATLSKLDSLNLSMNMLSFQLGSIDWIPPFQLTYISLGSCDVGPKFPRWLRTQTHWKMLNMSNASISDSIPHWLEKLPPSIDFVDLSHNKIHGIPNFTTSNLPFDPKIQILLSSNRLEGPLQSFPSHLRELDLSNNNITGPIPNTQVTSLGILALSNNVFSGSIPNSLCSMNDLLYLDLSTNHLSGDLPHCLSNITNIEVINFSSNNMSGTIPSSIGGLENLRSLHLSNNQLVGEIPLALQDCTSLFILDLGDNALSGQIPEWIGANMSSLGILRLRSNHLNGTLPVSLCHLERLHILDVSRNNLSGHIPPCFGNFNLMVFNNDTSTSDERALSFDTSDIAGDDKINQTIKGKELEYVKILSLVCNLDLSANNFTGGVPEELTNLSSLIGLNLSRNHLTGNIPKNINRMQSLESLDLSMNHFSGKIPQSISLLFKLNYLNLSYNDLSGPIPSSTQLQTLEDPSIYRGNKLCGPPLEKKCFEVENPNSPPKGNDKEKHKLKISSLYMGMIVGHVVGFWGICVILLFKKTWRYACFRFVEHIYDKLYVIIVIQTNRLKKKLKCNDTDE